MKTTHTCAARRRHSRRPQRLAAGPDQTTKPHKTRAAISPMASKIAQFPFVRELDGFDFDAQPSRWTRARYGSWRPAAGPRMGTPCCSSALPEPARRIWPLPLGARRSGRITACSLSIVATAILDRLLHHSTVVTIRETVTGSAKSGVLAFCRRPERRLKQPRPQRNERGPFFSSPSGSNLRFA